MQTIVNDLGFTMNGQTPTLPQLGGNKDAKLTPLKAQMRQQLISAGVSASEANRASNLFVLGQYSKKLKKLADSYNRISKKIDEFIGAGYSRSVVLGDLDADFNTDYLSDEDQNPME